MRIFLLLFVLLTTLETLAADVSFKSELAPILARRCLGCHNNRKTEGRYALHTFEQLLKPGDSGEQPIVPGKPSDSYFFQKLIESDESVRMPQEDDPLNAADIAAFKTWIEQGAKFDGQSVTDRLVTLLPARQHPQPPAKYRRPVPIFALRFSPDGQSLFTSGLHEVLTWNVATGKLKQRIANMPQRIHGLRCSPDGRTLAVAGGAPGEYGEIRIINLSDGSIRTLPAWEDLVLDIAFSGDGSALVAGGTDNSVRAYEVSSGKELWRNQQHVDWVTALDVTDYQFAEELIPNADSPSLFEFTEHEKVSGTHTRQDWSFPDGRYIVRKANWELEALGEQFVALTRITITGIGKTYNEKRERLTGAAEQEHAAVIAALRELHLSWGRSAQATPFVVTASRDRTAKVFGLRTGALFTTYKGHRREYGPLAGMYRVFGAQTEPSSRRVWSGGEGQHFHGWNPVTVRDEDGTAADMESRFAKEYSIDAVRHDIPQAVFSFVRSGPQLFTASAQGHVNRFVISGPDAKFNINAPAPTQAFAGQRDQLFAIDAHAGSNRLAATGFTGEVVIWTNDSTQPALRFNASP